MKKAKLFIIYFPAILVFSQVLVNILALIDREFYNSIGFYLNTFLGTNVFFAGFMIVFTFSFKFCDISKGAAIAEGLFALNYLIIQQDNLYNILFQIIVGAIALVITFRRYIKKFPFCRVSLLWKFLISVAVSGGSCSKGLDKWQKDLEVDLTKRHYERL